LLKGIEKQLVKIKLHFYSERGQIRKIFFCNQLTIKRH